MQFDKLKELTVHELRSMARTVGVKAPTTKTSQQLIKEIIAIENGELLPIRSNMGRPPKTNRYSKINQQLQESSLYENAFEEVNPPEEMIFRDDNCPEGINNREDDCYGIVREVDNKKYIFNYLSESNYDIFDDSDRANIKEGNLIVGKYKDIRSQSFITSYKKIELPIKSDQDGQCFVKTISSEQQMLDYINCENKPKIIVEVEACLKRLPKIKENEYFIYTKECDDIIKTYNMLLDVKNLIKNLCENNSSFAIYFVDVEYVYSILGMYYRYKNVSFDVNAGQYFKEILSLVKNSKGGEITLFEKELGQRSSYFDIIINKYCKKV